MTQLSRSIADTGEGTLRGQPTGLPPLAAYLSAPFWWIDDVPTAYTVVEGTRRAADGDRRVPRLCLARLVVRPAWALFAAAGTGLAPALAYAPILVKEPTAYPAATLWRSSSSHAGWRCPAPPGSCWPWQRAAWDS